ncbi:hypothetical protein OGAPHI_006888 [Ogataea philodendri]|uniref:Uncharacterized protein n=1 Tax=Ogataea philodendri TaxID=1378263 RepID=A0A9P8NVA0_9ASCO|nr:uncharacterized protein OGAPHI_006888 [Ogataea philodendri]KAH3660302.1 hypothetical protein OGAPHI_006888 [Ogataea philodendri]
MVITSYFLDLSLDSIASAFTSSPNTSAPMMSTLSVYTCKASAKCSEKKPVDTTRADSDLESKLAPTISHPRVPDPEITKP